MTTDQPKATIRDVVDAIDRQTEVIEALLKAMKAETLEKAAQEPVDPWDEVKVGDAHPGRQPGHSACLEPIAGFACTRAWGHPGQHVATGTKEVLAVRKVQNPAQDYEKAPLADAEHDQAAQPAADDPEPAQTLADLEPCLGDRVRAQSPFTHHEVCMQFGWLEVGDEDGFHWFGSGYFDGTPSEWTVLEHLDPVTPEEPPVGAGMLVDSCDGGGCLLKRFDDGWSRWRGNGWSDIVPWKWIVDASPLRPATPADLAEHGVDEDGEPVGKGEAFAERYPELRAWLAGDKSSGPSVVHDLHAALDFLGETEAGER